MGRRRPQTRRKTRSSSTRPPAQSRICFCYAGRPVADPTTNTCCTHPHWDEDPAICATRRLTEELGFTVPLEHRDQIEYRADVFNGLIEHEVVDIFVADLDGPPVTKPNLEEVMDIAWVTLEELRAQIATQPERFTPWIKIYVDQHSDQIFGERASS